MTNHAETLRRKIETHQAKVGVVGLGYVGLPLVVEFAQAGFCVTGIDVQQSKVDAINRGESYIQDVSTADVQALAKAGKIRATTDFSVVRELDTINICVPTPLRKTKDPDMSFIVNACQEMAKFFHPGTLVILESTTYPGTTDELMLPMFEEGGLKVGQDFFMCFSPERVDPGNPKYQTRNIPKVVGGITPACTEIGALFYQQALDTVVPVGSTRVAEMVKLLENTFRMINIGLVNEIALMCDRMGINVWEVIDAAATKPFGFMPFYPGPGLGGHCIPIDPFYLTWKAREYGQNTKFIELAGEINTSMPHYVVNRTAEALNAQRKPINGSKILLLGLAYKPNVDDMRESPTFILMDLFKQRGAEVAYYDPHIPVINPTREHAHWTGTKSVAWDEKSISQFDAVVVATAHKAVNYAELAKWAKCIVDTRNAMTSIQVSPEKIWKA